MIHFIVHELCAIYRGVGQTRTVLIRIPDDRGNPDDFLRKKVRIILYFLFEIHDYCFTKDLTQLPSFILYLFYTFELDEFYSTFGLVSSCNQGWASNRKVSVHLFKSSRLFRTELFVCSFVHSVQKFNCSFVQKFTSF